MTLLQQLAAEIEAGTMDFSDTVLETTGENGWNAYNGSLDAAKALHDAILPGYGWRIPSNPWTPHSVAVTSPVWQEDDETEGGHPQFDGIVDGNPARAWLLAIIRALIAQETKE